MANNASVKVKVEGEKEFKQAMANITQSAKTLSSEMKAVTSSFTSETSAAEKATKSMETLKKQQSNYEKELETLKKRHQEVADATGENSTQSLKLQESINKTQASLNKVNNELEECETTMNDAGTAAGKLKSKFGDINVDTSAVSSTIDNLTSKFVNLAKTGITAAATGVTALATALASLTKSSVESYADTEQLTGGIKKLYGEDAISVINNANNAYKNAGMNANDYMETVTMFSASLIKSLGNDTSAAAKLSDQAMQDISDNANTFGTEVSEVANVYKALAKEQYTTLDSLNLGYAGTKEGAKQLIADAEKLDSTFKASTDENGDYTLSFNEMVEALHIVQQNMNITGTTANEASKTISGSVNSMKNAWDNLVSGLASEDANLSSLVENLADATVDAMSNIIPAIQRVFENLPTVIQKIIPKAKSVLESFKKTAITVINSTITSIKTAFPSATSAVDGFVKSVKNLSSTILPALGNAILFVAKHFQSIVTIGATLLSTLVALKAAFAIQTTITAVSGALALVGPAASAGATAMAVLNGVMEANPFGAVAAAIALVVGGLVILASTASESSGTVDESAQTVVNNVYDVKDAVDELNTSIQELNQTNYKNAQAQITELAPAEEYLEILDSLVDEEGNVKQGKEDLVEQILGELSSAYGIEIDLIDGKIEKYTQLRSEILKTIETKKAEYQMDALESSWTASLDQQTEAETNYKNAVQATKDAEEEYNDAVSERESLQRSLNSLKAQASADGVTDQYEAAVIEEANLKLQAQIEKVDGLKTAWDTASESEAEAKNTLDQLTASQDLYTAALTAMGAEDYESVELLYESLKNGFSSVEEEAVVIGQATGSAYAKSVSDALANGSTAEEAKSLLPSSDEITGVGSEYAQLYINEINAILGSSTLSTDQIIEYLKQFQTDASITAVDTGTAIKNGIAEGVTDNDGVVKEAAENTVKGAEVTETATTVGQATGTSYNQGLSDTITATDMSTEMTSQISSSSDLAKIQAAADGGNVGAQWLLEAEYGISSGDLSDEMDAQISNGTISATNLASTGGKTVGTTYSNSASGAINTTAMNTNATTMVTNAKTAANTTAKGANSVGTTMSDSIAGGLDSETVKKSTSSLISAVNTAGQSTASMCNQIGYYMGKGIASGVSSSTSSVIAVLWGSVSSAVTYVKNKLGIASPSKLMKNLIGVNMAKGIAVGLNVGTKDVIKASDNSMNAILNNYKKNVASIPSSLYNQLGINSSDGLNYNVNLRNQTNMQEAMVQALQGVQVVMDGERIGRFITNTTTKEVYG